MHTLFNCASWVGHQSTIWSLGGIKPSCNTPQGHNTSYTQPAPLAHTAIPLIQLFIIFKTQKHNSYFSLFFDLEGRTPPRCHRTRVLDRPVLGHPSPVWLRTRTKSKNNTTSKNTYKKDRQQTTVVCRGHAHVPSSDNTKLPALIQSLLSFQKALDWTNNILNAPGHLTSLLQFLQLLFEKYNIL